jgi:hypothetical protein
MVIAGGASWRPVERRLEHWDCVRRQARCCTTGRITQIRCAHLGCLHLDDGFSTARNGVVEVAHFDLQSTSKTMLLNTLASVYLDDQKDAGNFVDALMALKAEVPATE